MRRLVSILAGLALALATTPAAAQSVPGYIDANGNVQRDGVNTPHPVAANQPVCTTVTSTLTGAGQSTTISCPNSGAFSIVVTPTSFVGSLTFTAGTGAPKRVTRNGQAPLQVSTVPYTATDSGPRYYAANGGNSLVVTVSAYTSGSVAVSLSASSGALYPIPIGEIQSSALVALLNGRGFTGGFPGGTLNVPNNNVACLTLTNPAASGVRAIFESRQLSTDVQTGQRPPRYYVVNNATTGLPSTAGTINNRGVGGSSAMTIAYGSLSALPTGGSTALGGWVPTGGITFSPPLEKTLEPGQNMTMCVLGVTATGVATDTSSPSVIFGWREQAVN